MTIPPEMEAAIAAKVAAMPRPQQLSRACEIIDGAEPDDIVNLEFAKLVLGPRATTQDLLSMLQRRVDPENRPR